jgi:hypothetical protein
MKTQLQLGATLDTLNQSELDDSLNRRAESAYQQLARGVSYGRFGPVGDTAPAGGVFTMDGTSKRQLGPRAGWMWSVRRMAVLGLAAGVTPDVINLFRNETTGTPIWQFNGNNWAYTFGKGEMILNDGESFGLAGTGLTTTSNITISGDFYSVPAEQIFKLL